LTLHRYIRGEGIYLKRDEEAPVAGVICEEY